MYNFFKEFPGLSILFFLLLVSSTCTQKETEVDNSDRADTDRLDHPHEIGWLFSVAPAGEILKPSAEWRDDIYDYEHVKQGDFSLIYRIKDGEKAGVFGFTPGPFIDFWNLNDQFSVAFWIRSEGEADRGIWRLILIDNDQNRADVTLDEIETDGRWYEVNLPLGNFEQETGFQAEQIQSLQVDIDLQAGSSIWFDDVRFVSPSDQQTDVGVSDKTIVQRLQEECETRADRVSAAFEETMRNGSAPIFNQLFAKLWLGENLQQVNRELYHMFTTDDVDIITSRQYYIKYHWSLSLNPMLIRMYYLFGSKSNVKPGRLNEETEAALLELLWERTKKINDIHLANKSTWWLIGSENHDINSKVAALLSSQIFMNEPEYADRVYPNAGSGGGDGYWFHRQERGVKGPEGGADWSDGKEYTAENHYEAWVGFWNEYITERARKGFFLEVASTGYMKHTIGFLQNLYDFSEDEDLRKRMEMFLDLIWAEWAQDQLGAVRGGAKTRWRSHGYDSMWEAARFYLGGPGHAEGWYAQLVSDYEWPEIIWRMALDPEGKGEFAYRSRKPGEEQPGLWPRPTGLERTMAIDTEARFLRYSWVTPDYILGTQMDHPAALHSHLSTAARWQGMSFASSFTTSVSPAGISTDNENKWERERHSYYRSVQYENVLITQQNRRWFQQNPSWYPTYDIYDRTFGVQFDGDFDQVNEREGWIFVQKGDAYLAVRPLMGEFKYDHETWSRTGTDELFSAIQEDSYDWGPNRQFIRLKDKYSPIVMEAGRRSTYPSMEEFQTHILAKRLALKKTVVPGWYIVIYGKGTPDSPEIYFNAANNEIPKVDGTYIEYAPAFTFDSPFMYSEYNSGIITLQVDGMQEILNFNDL